jgi:hypothetical protein
MSYTYGRSYGSDFYSYRVPLLRSLRAGTGSGGGVTHAYKVNWLYELPFGQGRRFGSNAGPVLDRIIGGWQVHGIMRLQSGEILDYGNVDLVGMSVDDLKSMFQVRIDDDGIVTYLPDDVILNTRRAFSTDPTDPTGYGSLGAPEGRYIAPAGDPNCVETIANDYGDCGTRTLQFSGPLFKNADISLVKAVPIAGRVRAEFRMEMLNAFNWVNFNPFATTSTTESDWQATGLQNGARIIQLVSRVSW